MVLIGGTCARWGIEWPLSGFFLNSIPGPPGKLTRTTSLVLGSDEALSIGRRHSRERIYPPSIVELPWSLRHTRRDRGPEVTPCRLIVSSPRQRVLTRRNSHFIGTPKLDQRLPHTCRDIEVGIKVQGMLIGHQGLIVALQFKEHIAFPIVGRSIVWLERLRMLIRL